MSAQSASLKLASLVGARPQFIKLAPLARVIAAHNEQSERKIEHLILHTGQHYDYGMSDIFFDELEIPHPTVNLGVGSGSHGAQTAQMLAGIESFLQAEKPDLLIIFGDTNSTVAGALAAAKLHIPIAHVEAGLRSFNRMMPEEINRIVADHTSDILLAPTPTAIQNLAREGQTERTVSSGDIMYDTVLHNAKIAETKSDILTKHGLTKGQYIVATCHRAENTNDQERLTQILDSFNEIAANHLPIVFPMHPRVKHLLPKVLPDWEAHERLHIIEPVGYLDMLQLVSHARLALTDSGGLQKEAFFLECPCVTMRDETEWVETVEAGGNIITGADQTKILDAVMHWLTAADHDFTDRIEQYFGKGASAQVTLDYILNFLAKKELAPAG